jgi:hypothetical protein
MGLIQSTTLPNQLPACEFWMSLGDPMGVIFSLTDLIQRQETAQRRKIVAQRVR